MEQSEYIILLDPTSPLNISDIDAILTTPSSEYKDKLSLSNLDIDLNNYPERAINSSFSSSFQKVGVYELSQEEVDKLLKIPDIKSITPLYSKGEPLKIPDLDLYSNFSNPELESSYRSNFRVMYGSTNNLALNNTSLSKTHIGNWAIYYHSLPPEFMYSGSLGRDTIKLFMGDSTSPVPELSHTNYNNFKYSVDGKNVDVIINEGNANPYSKDTKASNTAIEFNHPEFYGFDGNTRIQFINWANYGWSSRAQDCFYPHSAQWKPGFVSSMAHKQMVASSAVGLYNGYAKGANIYFLTGGASNINGWSTILNFHLNKPINPKTNRRNPTVVNCSQGTFYQYPYYQYELGGRSSGSFYFNTHGPNKGFRISHYGKDYIFVSGSNNNSEKEIKINGHNGYQQNPALGVADIYYYNTPDLSGLINSINTNISSYFTATVDLSTNLITITQTPKYRAINPKIYTGSIEDFIEVTGKPSPKGGSLAVELLGGFEPNTHINKIVVKGKEVFSDSNGFINSNHGYLELPPFDQYGIDKGINWVGNPLESTISTLVTPEYTGSGVTFNSIRLVNKTNGADGLPALESLNQIFYELAQNGVIVVTSAGNNPAFATHTSSSLEKNEFYDPDLFDEDVYNSYIEIDCRVSHQGTIQSLGPNTPLRFFTPSIVNNYTIINVGKLDFDPGNYITNANNISSPKLSLSDLKILSSDNNTVRGKGVDAYMGSGGCLIAGHQSDKFSFDFVTDECSFYEESGIKFNTKSLMDQYTQSFMSFDYYKTKYNFSTTLDGNGNIPFNIKGPQVNTMSGGTSNASPHLAGMIACYLQINPEANLNDVRKWIKSIGVPFKSNHDPERNNFLYYGGFQTSSNPDKPFHYTNEIGIHGYEMGPNPLIPHFPYNQDKPVEFKGTFNLSKVNFTL